MFRYVLIAILVCVASGSALGQVKQKGRKAMTTGPKPTIANFKYGDDSKRQVLDFWRAKSDTPTPVVLMIHGGGWVGGDKNRYQGAVQPFLDEGISVAAINYRLISEAMKQEVSPPVKAPLHDAARALQTLRSKAKEWNIDPSRIGATGSSAGACTSLWLAFHDDLASPESDDPIARQSTRLKCAAVAGAQTSLDPQQVREWIPNARYGGHAFGFMRTSRDQPKEFVQALQNREKVLPWIKEYSPIELATKDDPAIYLDYPKQKSPPAAGKEEPDPTHSAMYGVKLAEKLRDLGVDVVLAYPGNEDSEYGSVERFLIEQLSK